MVVKSTSFLKASWQESLVLEQRVFTRERGAVPLARQHQHRVDFLLLEIWFKTTRNAKAEIKPLDV